MNHCTDCGNRISAGRTLFHSTKNGRCEPCLTADRLRDWRYVSPAAKRWQRKKGATSGT